MGNFKVTCFTKDLKEHSWSKVKYFHEVHVNIIEVLYCLPWSKPQTFYELCPQLPQPKQSMHSPKLPNRASIAHLYACERSLVPAVI